MKTQPTQTSILEFKSEINNTVANNFKIINSLLERNNLGNNYIDITACKKKTSKV